QVGHQQRRRVCPAVAAEQPGGEQGGVRAPPEGAGGHLQPHHDEDVPGCRRRCWRYARRHARHERLRWCGRGCRCWPQRLVLLRPEGRGGRLSSTQVGLSCARVPVLLRGCALCLCDVEVLSVLPAHKRECAKSLFLIACYFAISAARPRPPAPGGAPCGALLWTMTIKKSVCAPLFIACCTCYRNTPCFLLFSHTKGS
ncbi:Hypothetical protein, putative, partial [Bodo saltans]